MRAAAARRALAAMLLRVVTAAMPRLIFFRHFADY